MEQHKGGTLRYSPPELVSGSSYEADPKFDVWSLGILLFKLVFGKFPFNGKKNQDLRKEIVNKELEFPPVFQDLHLSVDNLATHTAIEKATADETEKALTC